MEMEYRYDCCESPSILYIYSRLGRREDGRTGSRSSEKRRIYDKMDLGVRGGGWRRRRPGRWRWSARQSVTPGAIWPIRDRPQKWASFVPILRVEDEKWDTALRLSQKKRNKHGRFTLLCLLPAGEALASTQIEKLSQTINVVFDGPMGWNWTYTRRLSLLLRRLTPLRFHDDVIRWKHI